MRIFEDFFGRLRRARGWVGAQFGGMLLMLLLGIGWTRLPDRHGWQVALSLLSPLLLAAALFALQAGTMRRLADDDGKRVKLAWGAMTLLVWVALGCAAWAMLDWCDDQIWGWTLYLNSRASAHGRVTVFTIPHISDALTFIEWVLRWIVVPAKVIPYAAASAQWGWRLPWRRVLRMLWNWRWWPAVVVAALVSVWLPGRFFAAEPHGTVSAQIWRVGLKLAAAYLLAVGCWVLVLGWAATLFGRQLPPAGRQPPADEALSPVPVLAGPPARSLGAKAEVPPMDEGGAV